MVERERGKWKSMKAWQKAVAFSACAVVAVAAIVAIGIANKPKNHVVLCTGLGNEETGAVYTALQGMGVEVKTEPGNTILVPDTKLEEIQTALQAQGVQLAPVVEEAYDYDIIFPEEAVNDSAIIYPDEAIPFNPTAEEKERIYRQQVSQNLENTINGMAKIERSTVLLTPMDPNEYLWPDGPRYASATVAVTPKPGQALDEADYQSIRELVSGAVQGLTTDDVLVVNSETEETWGADTAA